ncbi:MAG: hypothetical protein AMXMBFR48_14470 [Ignavibacteriales bacterium]
MQPAVYKKLADSLSSAKITKPENHLLFLTKYCSIWRKSSDGFVKGADTKEKDKKDFISEFGRTGSKDLADIIKASNALRKTSLEMLNSSGMKAASFRLSTMTRSAVGMGGMSPLENSITLHHIYGFPVLPGSTLKGAARAFAEAQENVDKSLVKKIFGSEDKNANEDSDKGKVFFWDALPTDFPKFTADILTPHYGEYYSNDNVPPGDYMTPVPVAFLCLDKGAEFYFSITSYDEALLKKAEEWLKGALTTLGIGAKTNLGYGIFADPDFKIAVQQGTSASVKSGNAPAPSAPSATPEENYEKAKLNNDAKTKVNQGDTLWAVVTAELLKGECTVKVYYKGFGEKSAKVAAAPAGISVGNLVEVRLLGKPEGELKLKFVRKL